MMTRITKSALSRTVCLLAMVVSSRLPLAKGCDTPVYQYALQNWPADAYEMVVVRRGTEESGRLVERLKRAADGFANLVVREAEAASVTTKYGVKLPEGEGGDLPWLLVRYPVREGGRRLLWSGAITTEKSNEWLDSPLRKKIAKMLLDGYVGVWLFLDGGDSRKDEAAFKLMSDELARLERVMPLPEGMEERDDFKFGIVRLRRDDTTEVKLCRMLLQSEPDLLDFGNEPMVFPIFGRGMALYTLIGAGINVNTIADAAGFLAGDCSCEIKSQNPGLELLMMVNWEKGIGSFSGLAGFVAQSALAESTLDSVDSNAEEELAAPLPLLVGSAEAKRSNLLRMGAIFGSAAAVLLAISALLQRSKRGKK